MPRVSRFLAFPVLLSLMFFLSCNDKRPKNDSSFDIYKSYKERGIGTLFAVPPGLASIFLDSDQAGNVELKDLLSDINHLSFLIIPNNTEIKENIYFTEVSDLLDEIDFVDLAMVNNGNEIVKVKILHGDNDQIIEMVVLVSNYDNFFSISFKGDIQISKIANLTKPENMVAVSNLNRFQK
jgi:hypothetical protein